MHGILSYLIDTSSSSSGDILASGKSPGDISASGKSSGSGKSYNKKYQGVPLIPEV